MKINYILIILSLLMVVSCENLFYALFEVGTGIGVINNTGEQILIECTTIYDTELYEVTMDNGKLHSYKNTIDAIFTDINVYTFADETKTLLYDKNYFLDTKNIELKRNTATIYIKL